MNNKLNILLSGIDQIRENHVYKQEDHKKENVRIDKILDALSSFTDCVRYLNTRRSAGALLNLDSEASVQDALFLMIRPWIIDLVPENPTDKIANRFSIKDFLSKSCHLVIEVKYIRDKEHGKTIVQELNDDIETYRYHHYCDDLIFFIYDPDGLIPDAGAVQRHIASSRAYDEKVLKCHLIIKP